MASPERMEKGITLLELVIVIAVVLILVSLSPVVTCGPAPGSGALIQAVNHARQIHLAVMCMAEDGRNNADPELGWPGDLKAKGQIATAPDFVNRLVKYDYLKAGDLKVFAAAGVTVYPNSPSTTGSNGPLKPPFEEKYNAFKIFLIKDKDASETVFLTSKNYAYGAAALNSKAKPFGDKGFVVCHKAGDTSIYKKQQLKNLHRSARSPAAAPRKAPKTA